MKDLRNRINNLEKLIEEAKEERKLPSRGDRERKRGVSMYLSPFDRRIKNWRAKLAYYKKIEKERANNGPDEED